MTDNTEQHKASTEQWADIERSTQPIELHPGVFVGTKDTTIANCILELRARVEALEAANDARTAEIIRLTNAVAAQLLLTLQAMTRRGGL